MSDRPCEGKEWFQSKSNRHVSDPFGYEWLKFECVVERCGLGGFYFGGPGSLVGTGGPDFNVDLFHWDPFLDILSHQQCLHRTTHFVPCSVGFIVMVILRICVYALKT